MNKIVDVALAGLRKSKTVKATRKKPIADLREWWGRVEAIGEMTRVRQPGEKRSMDKAENNKIKKKKAYGRLRPCPGAIF
jgi:hypothetical protein